MNFEKFEWLLSPIVLISIGLIMKLSSNEKQFGLLLKYKKYWLFFIIGGIFSFLMELYKFLYLN